MPGHRTSFVGRVVERRQVSSLAQVCPFVTLIGPAGVGKTRLALEVAAERGARSQDGVAWLDLSTLASRERYLAALASAFGFHFAPPRRLIDLLKARLRLSDATIVLDNCEHLVEEATPFVVEILNHCDAIRILATSRRPFALDAEVTYRVPSMGLPHADERDRLDQHDATRLFVERAGLKRIAADDVSLVVEICRRLDGLPLAIELVASRASEMSLGSLAEAIGRELNSIPSGGSDAETRYRSLEASLDWSYRALAESERTALRGLAIFNGHFSSESAYQVARADAGILATLVERSLVMADPVEPHPMRYRLLETVRQFADQRLTDAERQGARNRLVDHLLTAAAAAQEGLLGPEALGWLERIDLDHHNFLAAMDAAVDGGRDADAADLVAKLLWHWITLGKAPEVRRYLEAAIEGSDAPPERRVDWFWAAGRLAQYEWDRESAQRYAREGAAIGRSLRRDDVVARCVAGVAWMRLVLDGDRAEAKREFDEALTAAQRADDDAAIAFALEGLATISMSIGDWPEARRIIDESMAYARRGSPHEVLVDDFIWLVYVAFNLGDDETARSAVAEAMTLGHRINDPFHRSCYRTLAAAIQMRSGEVEEARALLADADRLATLSAAPFPRMLCDAYRALLAYREGEPPAAQLLEAAAEQGSRSVMMHIAGSLYAHAAELACERGDLQDAERLIGLARRWRSNVGGPDAGIAIAQAAKALARGDLDEADSRCHVALSEAASVSADPSLLEALEMLAAVLARKGVADVASRLLGAADGARSARGWMRAKPASLTYHSTLDVLASLLRPGAIAAAVKEGASLSLGEAVSYARRGRGGRDRPVAGWESLTPVELDVVRLAAGGFTNAQIADRLFVSPATVKTHLVHVYAKLGFGSRSQLIAEAVRRGIEEDRPAG